MISEALLRFGGHRAVEEALLDISPQLLAARRRGKIDSRNFVSIFSTILEGRENRGAARCRTRAKVRELRGSYERHPAGSPSAGTGASSRPPVSWAAFKALSCPPSAHMEKKIAALTASSALSGIDQPAAGAAGWRVCTIDCRHRRA